MRVVGCMSGTSYDAVDAAVIDLELDGDVLVGTPLGMLTAPVPEQIRAAIAALLPPATTSIEQVCWLDTALGQLFGEVTARACESLAGGSADLIACHGQTVFHWVEDGVALGTLQLGSPAWIAEATGVPVVSDLRTRDITRGGQGAPLVPMLDNLLILQSETRRGSLNLGGIANITVPAADGAVIAYDIGPANALIDAAVTGLTGGVERMDVDGARAARGTVQEELLRRLLADPYYGRPAPKSTGKELFHGGYVQEIVGDVSGVDADDLVATLTELTAVLVARACREHSLAELVVAGGGIRNPALMARLRERCAPAAIRPVDDFGIPAQAKEAYAFAVLGYLTVHGLAGTVAGATGASRPSVLGSITPGREPLRLPEPVASPPTRMVIKPA